MAIDKGKLAVVVGGLVVIAGLQVRGQLRGDDDDVFVPVILNGQLANADPSVLTVERHHGRGGLGICTGTLIGPRFVLTAKHCTGGGRLNVVLGEGSRAPRINVARTHLPPDRSDIAVLELVSAPPGLTPIRVSFDTRKIGDLDEARIVGVGKTGTRTGGAREIKRTVTAPIRATHDFLMTQRAGVICYGDSGGPALGVIDGHEEVVAVSSSITATNCERGHGRFVRTDRHAGFLSSFVGDAETPVTPLPTPTPVTPVPTPAPAPTPTTPAPRVKPMPPARPPRVPTTPLIPPPPPLQPTPPPPLPPSLQADRQEESSHAEAFARNGHVQARAHGANAYARAEGGHAVAHAESH